MAQGRGRHAAVQAQVRQEGARDEDGAGQGGGRAREALPREREGRRGWCVVPLSIRSPSLPEADEVRVARAARKERALLGFEEDRLDRAARDERGALVLSRLGFSVCSTDTPSMTGATERLVREARAAEPQTAPAPYSTGPSSFARQSGRTTARMGRGFSRAGAAAFGDEEEAEEDDDDEHEDGMGEDDGAVDDDAPPSYGELHGRVLGTGLPPGGEAAPPAGVSMVNAQDLDEAE